MSSALFTNLLSLFLVASSVSMGAAHPAPETRRGTLSRHEESRVSMGCDYTIVAYGANARRLIVAVDEAFGEIDRIDRLMSNYKPQSPLSIINREAAGAPVKVEMELFAFIEECLRYSRESEGAFDITVGPLMKAWGFFRDEGRVPDSNEISELRSLIGYRHVILNASEKSVQFDRSGVELDLGGIAKGYAVDRAAAVLRNHNVRAALINAGGSTIYGMGAPPGKDGWRIKISDPLNGDRTVHTVRLKDRALSLSGGSEKFFESGGVRYSHIMDPRTACPSQNMLGVAVIAKTGTMGDALDNIFYVQSMKKSREYLKHLPATEVFLFMPAGADKWRVVRMRN